MPISVTCPCGAHLSVPKKKLGQSVLCPKCQKQFVVPESTADSNVTIDDIAMQTLGQYQPKQPAGKAKSRAALTTDVPSHWSDLPLGEPGVVKAHGVNGQLELTDRVVRIKRGGLLALVTQGLKGDKEILVAQISSIQFKDAGPFFNGYIQFAYPGSQESKGGIFQATKDENSVMFNVDQQAEFAKFRHELQKRLAVVARGPSRNRRVQHL